MPMRDKKVEFCEWKMDYPYVEAGCCKVASGGLLDFVDPELKDKDWHFRFCPYCGKPIKVAEE